MNSESSDPLSSHNSTTWPEGIEKVTLLKEEELKEVNGAEMEVEALGIQLAIFGAHRPKNNFYLSSQNEPAPERT